MKSLATKVNCSYDRIEKLRAINSLLTLYDYKMNNFVYSKLKSQTPSYSQAPYPSDVDT